MLTLKVAKGNSATPNYYYQQIIAMALSSYILASILHFGIWNTEDSHDIKTQVKDAISNAQSSIYSNPTKSIEIINQITPLLANENLIEEKATASLIKGRCMLNLGLYESAFESLYNGYESCPSNNTTLKMQLAIFLGDTYRSLKLDKKANDFVQKALTMAISQNDSSAISLCYNVLGLIKISLNENKLAEKYFSKSLEINRKLNLLKPIAANLNNLCLYPNNQPLEKVKLLNEAIEINSQLGATWSIAENYNNMSVQYFYAKEYEKAMKCLNKAFLIANQLDAKELISDNYRYKSWVYEAVGDYKNAYSSFKHLYEKEMDMLSDKRVSKIEGDRINKMLAKKQEELLLNQKEYEIKTLKNGRIIFLLGSVSILLISGFIFFKFKQSQRLQQVMTLKKLAEKERELAKLKLLQAESDRKNIETELKHSKNDLTNFACYIKSKNDFLEILKADVKKGYTLPDDELRMHLKLIKNNIVQYQNSSNEQNILIEEIEAVNAEFIHRLASLHPDLTKNEKSLASLLRIELSTKDIANVVGSSPKTVNMARYRLRKKLKLETDELLTEYMKRI